LAQQAATSFSDPRLGSHAKERWGQTVNLSSGNAMAPLLKKILVASMLLLLALILMLCLALRTKVNDVSGKQPYAEFMNRPLVLKRAALSQLTF
jgi:hypothetical protein